MLYTLQRTKRHGWHDTSAAAVEEDIVATFSDLPPLLPSPTGVHAPRIVDIGAGLGMYHIPISRLYAGRSDHFIVDVSPSLSAHRAL
jgi:hypothetical protein